MERRRLGRTDIVVSVLGFGGSEIGYERASVRTVERLLGGALDAGLNVVDTAECYEDSEALIGKAIGARRREVHLFTKCGHPGGWSRANWRPKSLLASIERSLKRLRTDYLDLIQLHSCSLAELRKGDVDCGAGAGAGARVDPLHRLQRRRRGGALRRGVRAVRHAADLGQRGRPAGDRPDAAAGPRAQRGGDRQAAAGQRRLALCAQALGALLSNVLVAASPARLRVLARRPGTARWGRPCASRSPCPVSTRPSSGRDSRSGGSRTRPCSRPGRCRRRSSSRSGRDGGRLRATRGRVRFDGA